MEQPQVEVSRHEASLSVVGQNLSAFPESIAQVRLLSWSLIPRS
jgi:hypothetical protein